MTPQTAIIKLRLRLNKSHSSDYDNIEDWIAVEAINKAALEWTRRQIEGLNQRQEGAEETRTKINDIQFLLTPKTLKGRNNNLYFESEALPSNYMAFSAIIPQVTNSKCDPLSVKSYLVEEANIPSLISDWAWSPSFEWRQSLHTIVGNKIRVYTNSEFDVVNIHLMYYRRPKAMDIAGYEHETGIESSNIDLEFKDDVAEIILDEAASIIAGDIESPNTFEATKGRANANT